MVKDISSVTPNFEFTIVNFNLVSYPNNGGENKVDLIPDKNLVSKKKKKSVGISLVYLNHVYFVDSLSCFRKNK